MGKSEEGEKKENIYLKKRQSKYKLYTASHTEMKVENHCVITWDAVEWL